MPTDQTVLPTLLVFAISASHGLPGETVLDRCITLSVPQGILNAVVGELAAVANPTPNPAVNGTKQSRNHGEIWRSLWVCVSNPIINW
jgi:hypothetical protein